MKKMLLVTLMFGTLISYANENNEPTNTVDAKRVKVEYKTVKKGQTITIKNENEVTLYKQVIKSTGRYSKIFDLTNLENGLYTTELEKDFEIIVKKFEVKDGFATFLTGKDKMIFKPVIRTEGDLILISKISFNNDPIKVDLHYNGDIIHTEEVECKRILNKVYKVSSAETGVYKVVISTENRVYEKYLKI